MAALTRRYLVEGIAVAATVYPIALLRGNPRSRVSGSDDGGAVSVAFPLGGIAFGAVAGRRMQEVERCTSTTLTAASLGGMAPRGSRRRVR